MSASAKYVAKFSMRDPIHGPIPFTEVEKEIIDTLYFQRLRNIVQNSMCYRVFSGARHTRFEHSIGVMHLAGRLFEALNRSSNKFISFSEAYGLNVEETERMKQTFRLGAMLHDIGHGPFSHAAEELTGAKHHESWSLEFISSDPIKSILKNYDIDSEEVQLVAVELKEKPPGPMNMVKRTPVIAQLNLLLAGELGVDRMDYLMRDSYYCGVRYGMFEVERLIECMHLYRTPDDALKLVLDADGVSAAEAMTFARFQMFSSVYYHKTVIILNWHLSQFVAGQLAEGTYPQDLLGYAAFDDSVILRRMNEAVISDTAKGHDHALALLKRQHHRLAWQATPELLHRQKMGKPGDLIKAALAKEGLEEEKDFVYRGSSSASQRYSASQIEVFQNGGVHNFSGSAPVASALPRIKFARVYVPEHSTHRSAVLAVLNHWEESLHNAHETEEV